MNSEKLIYQGYVINNQDPLMLGRIRAIPIDEIESDLLEETNYINAVSVDFDSKYMIVINDNAYVYDYEKYKRKKYLYCSRICSLFIANAFV
jgi:hypothetical protein